MEELAKLLLDNTREAAERYHTIRAELSLPETAADSRYYLHLTREEARVAPYAAAHDRISHAVEALDRLRREKESVDDELLPLYREEEKKLAAELTAAVEDARALQRFVEQQGTEPCVMTVRDEAGTGFAADVVRLYARYLDRAGIPYSLSEDKEGGVLEVGEGGYGRLRREAGLHKRSDGNSASVTVTPVYVKGKVTVSPEELRVDIFCSSGKGGQNVNKVETAVRVTHLPTGLVVTCQDERSQLMNKRRAIATLTERLQAAHDRQSEQDFHRARDEQIRDRSNPVRRYDLAHDVIVDPRTKVGVSLKKGMRGDIDPLVKAIALMP